MSGPTAPRTGYRKAAILLASVGDEASADLDTRLVLILANHVGDLDVLHQAIALAKATGSAGRA